MSDLANTDPRWPWPTRVITTTVGDIAVTDAGSPDAPPILLVHVGLGSLIWHDLITHLEARFRLVTLDAPGTGASVAAPVGLNHAAVAVEDVVEALDLQDFTLVAHDLGDPASIAACERIGERVTGLIAINTFGWRPTGPMFRGMLALMGSAPMRATDAWLGWLPALSSSRWGVGRHWDRARRRAYRNSFDPDRRRAFHRYMADARHNEAIYDRTERALTGPLADIPVLTVFGERNDPLGLQQQWKARFPNAVQETVPKGYHFPMCDAPQQVARMVEQFHARQGALPQ